MAFDGGAHAKIANGENVGTAKSKDEEHVSGPDAHALNVRQDGDHFVIAHGGQAIEVDFTAERALGQVANVADLLFGEAGAPHLAQAQVLDGLRSDASTRGFFQPAINRPGGLGA